MRYEIPLMALGALGHVAAVLELPVLREQPLPVRVGVAVLPTVLLLAQALLPDRGLSLKASAGLSLAAGLLHLGWSLALPVALVVGAAVGPAPVGQAVASALGWLLLLLPALLLAFLLLSSALDTWRGATSPDPSP